MKHKNQMTRHSSCLIICVLFLSNISLQGQVMQRSIEEMTLDAKTIIHGKCTQIHSSWDVNQERIYTEINVIANEYLKGPQGTEIIITIPGGQVGNYVYEVSDMPRFSEGEEFVAFLSEHSSGRNLVTGAVQGKLKIRKDPHTGALHVKIPVEEPASTKKSAMIFDESTQEMEDVPLGEFLSEIKGYLGQ